MKLGFVFQRDSHLKAVQATALRLSNQYPGAQIQFYGIDSHSRLLQGVNALEISSSSLELLSDCDYLICCLGGYLLNTVIASFRHSHTKVISLFPGIVSHYQLDAYISRLHADQVWLNSESDYLLYQRICEVFRVENNSICHGAAWLNLPNVLKVNQPQPSKEVHSVIFFEQIEILSDKQDQRFFFNLMLDLFKNHPKVSFVYKIRSHAEEGFLDDFRRKISFLCNVTVVDNLTDEQVDCVDAYLSISSSALIEGLLMHKSVGLLNASLMDKYSMEFYRDSNLFLKDSKLNFSKPNSEWISQRIAMPCQTIDLYAIKKNQTWVSPTVKRHFVFIIFYILKLTVFHPKMIGLAFSKESLASTQKALEYLQNSQGYSVNTNCNNTRL